MVGSERRAVLAARRMVVAAHPAVSAAGHRVLAEGGNAVDATLAMAAMCWLALPGQCGIGGDAFAVVREPDGRVWTVGGSGFGPDGAEPGFHGDGPVPTRGALSVAVPGAVGALSALHRQGASRSLDELWRPAVEAAETGVACSAKTHRDVADNVDLVRGDAGLAAMFLPHGSVPAPGARLTFPEFAATLKTLAAAPESFYDGELAHRAVDHLRALGAPFSGAEWQACAVPLTGPPVTGTYGELTVHQTPLPTPGWMMLQQAAVCDGVLSGLPALGGDAVHWLAAAARRAFADRFAFCGSDNDAWQDLLTTAATAAAREDIRSGRLAPPAGTRPDGDTTSTVAVDDSGRAVSFIHSLAFTFGSGVTVPGTGIVLNNRFGRGAYTLAGHPNEARPRRRPLHTLNAWIATDARGRLRFVGNTPGGDGQVQWNMQVLSHLADHGLDPQQAVSAPRFTIYPGSDADTLGDAPELRCEDRLGDDVLAAVAAHGHRVRRLGPWEAGGSALVIAADHETGSLAGGADPRQDGVALGD
ncbi:gamma-glutamyltransferase family protein [Prauserella oleivorans]|uniref:Gamma-glutamyltransferase family protein n=1 Tax=Prauserella oleivorans TaxID=1478153 RepID=A0ABW5WAY1_9PSEU